MDCEMIEESRARSQEIHERLAAVFTTNLGLLYEALSARRTGCDLFGCGVGGCLGDFLQYRGVLFE